MSDDVMSVMTPYPDVAQLAQGYMQRADGERLWVPLPAPSQPGAGVRFVIHLADGTVGFAGAGRCVQVADQGEGVDPAIRFEALLDTLQFDERSRPVYDYIVAVRAAALEAAQGDDGQGYALDDGDVADVADVDYGHADGAYDAEYQDADGAYEDVAEEVDYAGEDRATPAGGAYAPDPTEEFQPHDPLALEGAGEPDLPSVAPDQVDPRPEPESAMMVQTQELQAYGEPDADMALDAEIDMGELTDGEPGPLVAESSSFDAEPPSLEADESSFEDVEASSFEEVAASSVAQAGGAVEDTYDPALEAPADASVEEESMELVAEVSEPPMELASPDAQAALEYEQPVAYDPMHPPVVQQVAPDQAPPQPLPGSSLPAPEPVDTGILTRPALATTAWRPIPGRRPKPQPASGLFQYRGDGIPQPASVPRPQLDPAYVVQPAPHPRDFRAPNGNGSHEDMELDTDLDDDASEDANTGGEVVNMSAPAMDYDESAAKIAD